MACGRPCGTAGQSLWHTRWSLIEAARTLDPARRQEVMGLIYELYRRPVYAYLRREGRSHEDAEDIAQSFFMKVVLGREIVQKADPAKGRFRSFLQTALARFLKSWHKQTSAKKRKPAGGLVPLDAQEDAWWSELSDSVTPEAAFAHAWAAQLLDEVLAVVETSCRQDGLDSHWEVFRRTVVEPALRGAEPPTMAELAAELNLPGPVQASNMNVTVKRRFRLALRDRVSQSVGSREDTDAEIRDLIDMLSTRSDWVQSDE